jgi:hypothetical protein
MSSIYDGLFLCRASGDHWDIPNANMLTLTASQASQKKSEETSSTAPTRKGKW